MPKSTEGTLALTVDNTGFLLDRLGQDCHPLQFLRELTQNSIEAIERSRTPGQIIWDVDWNSYDLADEPVYKVSIIDTGDGMTGEEMVHYINKLSASVAGQSLTGNYGVGAKVAAATRNHAGLIYTSWKDGRGYMIHLWRDPETGQYGLRQISRPDGSFGHYAEVEDDVKPEIVGDHGTAVILLGNSAEEDTMRAPEGAAAPSRWIAKYLNSRYLRIPEAVTVRAREGWEHPRVRDDKDRNLLRTVVGQANYLEQHAKTSGTAKLTNASAHWWILKDEKALSQNSGWIESSGHIAALYQNELYELASARAGRAQLQNFGVLLGTNRVVIYVEPDTALEVTTNTARTHLLIGNEPLPWHDWAMEFALQIPAEIQELMDEVAAGSSSADHTKAIRDRLKQIMDLFRVSRYRPTPAGMLEIDMERRVRGGQPASGGSPRSGRAPRSGGRGGAAGGIYAAFLKKGGNTADEVNPDAFPKVRWVSVADGTRESGDIEDRAARFLMDQNCLLVNADFRVFRDMFERWRKEFSGGGVAIDAYVEDAVRNWFEQSLVETVLGAQGLKDSKEWSVNDIQRALSEESLTAAVMQRYHVNNAVKRELGSKLGRLRREG